METINLSLVPTVSLGYLFHEIPGSLIYNVITEGGVVGKGEQYWLFGKKVGFNGEKKRGGVGVLVVLASLEEHFLFWTNYFCF